MFTGFLIPFFSITAAELLDKSQLMIILLASRTRHHLQLFFGVMLAFILVDGMAIAAGVWLAEFIPAIYIKIISGVGFIIFGILNLREEKDEKKKNIVLKNPFISGLTLIFLAEWGDKTQIASGLFATRFDPVFVFFGVMFALGILSIAAIYLGRYISKKFDSHIIRKVSGIIFIFVGLLFFFL